MNTDTKERRESYVVVRNNIRVSDKEYLKEDDAQNEFEYWHKLVKDWPDGSKVEVVKKDSRLHRIYNL
jgi:hypothetical protein